jgi:hypothetical protein
LIGICPVHEEKNGILRNLYSGQYNYIPYGGWIFKKEYEFYKFPLRFNQLFAGFNFPVNNNLKLKGKNRKFQTLVIDLSLDYENYYLNYNRNTKRNIVKAINSNISLVINNDIDFFFPFYRISCENKGLKEMGKTLLIDLMNSLKNIKIDILWAIRNNVSLAFLALVYDKDYCLTWLTYNLPGFESFGQGHFLHTEAIKHSILKGCKYFDLCYIEKERLPNICEFKRGFSKNEVEVPLIIQKPLSYKVINRIKRCF